MISAGMARPVVRFTPRLPQHRADKAMLSDYPSLLQPSRARTAVRVQMRLENRAALAYRSWQETFGRETE